jgi:hypothetical protein
MVIDEIDVDRITLSEVEDDPPVRTHRDRPESPKLALQRVQTEAVNVQIFHSLCGIERCENQSNSCDMLRRNSTGVIVLIKPT